MCQYCFAAVMARLEAGEVLDFSHVTGDLAPPMQTGEVADLGSDSATAVTDDFGSKDSKFRGKARKNKTQAALNLSRVRYDT